MKKNIVLLVLVIFLCPVLVIAKPANSAFKDDNFYQCVVDAYNSKNNTSLSVSTNLTDAQLQTIKGLSCQSMGIADASGTEKLTGLTNLHLGTNEITEIDLSKNTLLTWLALYSNDLTSIDLSKNVSLEYLSLNRNQLTNINLSKNTELTRLDLGKNNLTSINLSSNTALSDLIINENQLSSISVTNNPLLEKINAERNNLSSINVSNNTELKTLELAYNHISNINLTNNTKLYELSLGNNQFKNIDISKNTVLGKLYLYDNQLTNVDLSKNLSLEDLDLSNNILTDVDLNKNVSLKSLYLEDNQLISVDLSKIVLLEHLNLSNNRLTNIDLSNNIYLKSLHLVSNLLTNIDLSKNVSLVYLYLDKNRLVSIDLSKNILLKTLYLNDNQLPSIDLSNNTALVTVVLRQSNPMMVNQYIFSGDVVDIIPVVKIGVPNTNIYHDNVKYSKEGIVTMTQIGKITAKSYGNVDVNYSAWFIPTGTGYLSSFYGVVKAHVSDLTSSKYNIDKENATIDVKNDMKVSTVLANLSPLNGQVFVYDSSDNKVTSGNIQNGYKIKVENDGHVVKTFTPEVFSYGTYQDNISGNYFILNGNVTGNDIKNNITLVNKTLDSFKINNGNKALDSNLEVGDTINLKVSGETITLEVTDITIGDVNGDNHVNIADCVYIAQALLGEKELTASQRKAGDFNNDGNVNIADCVAIAQKLLE